MEAGKSQRGVSVGYFQDSGRKVGGVPSRLEGLKTKPECALESTDTDFKLLFPFVVSETDSGIGNLSA
jgi:hypothetical protein